MIVWVFAGGGESEISGLLPFLRREFPNCDFQRITPVSNKDGRKPKKFPSPQGLTGKSLLKEVEDRLTHKFKLNDPLCQLILIFDDLDYPPLDSKAPNEFSQQKHQEFENVLNKIWKKHPQIVPINHVIGFAKPELESWVVADWYQTVAKDLDFREKAEAMRRWLANERKLLFSSPEDFGLDPEVEENYHKKLSDTIIESAKEQEAEKRYSKRIHTARFIKQLDSAIAQQKCPEFRKFFTTLSRLTQESKS